jgi:hypothetical protein
MTRVVDVSNSASFEDVAVMKFFEASTRNLLAQEASRWGETSRCSFSRGNGAPVRKREISRRRQARRRADDQ